LSANGDITEQELINEYRRSGEQSKMGQLFSPYLELLYGVCLKYLKDPNAAEDAVMDVYVLVSKKLLKHEVKDFRPWLYVVTKNHCFDILRKAKKRIEKEKSAQHMYSETIFHPDSVVKETLLVKMEQCIEKLNKEQKCCIDAFYYKSMTYEQIAASYDLSWNQVRSNIQNGRRKLKICLDTK